MEKPELTDESRSEIARFDACLTRVEIQGCALFANVAYQTYTVQFDDRTHGSVYSTRGMIGIRIEFERPDTNTGAIGMGYSRWEFLPFGSSEDSIIKTAFLLAKLIAEHETMEAFQVDGKRVFNPHRSIFAHKAGECLDSGTMPTDEDVFRAFINQRA